MKLVYCPDCQDLVRLFREDRRCKCGQSGGHYEPNGRDAVLWGQAIPFGLDNFELGRALQRRPEAGLGRAVSFFIIPRQSTRISYQEQDSNWYWERYQRTGRYEDMTTWLKHKAWEKIHQDQVWRETVSMVLEGKPIGISRVEIDPSREGPGDTNPCLTSEEFAKKHQEKW